MFRGSTYICSLHVRNITQRHLYHMKAYALNVILNKPDASRSKLCEQERQS